MKDRIIWGFLAATLLIIVLLSDSLFINIAYLFITVVAILELYNLILKRRDVTRFLLFVLASVFIASCFYTILLLRMQNDIGHIIVWFAFAGAFLTDTFAYIFGMWIGQKRKHFIFPNISPKKTFEGVIGGIVGVTVMFYLWGIVGNLIFSKFLNGQFSYEFNIVNLVILGFLCGFVAQGGDLLASLLKRKFRAKDFGSILPGHGGILDRCDSLMLTGPFVLLFNTLFPVIFFSIV